MPPTHRPLYRRWHEETTKLQHLKEKGANVRAMGNLASGLGWVIIVGVVLYAEFAFLSIVSGMFPPGLGAILASIGAVATGISIIALAIMKATGEIHPGGHEIISWGALGMETTIMGLNLMLSFASTGMFGLKIMGFLVVWEQITPASPLAALIIWVLLMYANPQHMLRHKQTELDDKIEAERMEVGYQTKKAQVDISRRYVARIAEKLDAAVDSQQTAHLIQRAADAHTAKILSDLIGTEVSPGELRSGASPNRKTIESSARKLPTKEEQKNAPASATFAEEITLPEPEEEHQTEPLGTLLADEELENMPEEELMHREPEPVPVAPQKKKRAR